MSHAPDCEAIRSRVACLTDALALCGGARASAPPLESEDAVEYTLGHLDIAEAKAAAINPELTIEIRVMRGCVREYADDGDQTTELCDCGALRGDPMITATDPKLRLVLDAGHAEYPLVAEHLTVRAIHDPLSDDAWSLDRTDEEAEAALKAAAPDGFEAYDASWCTVYEAEGSQAAFNRAYADLLGDVGQVPSGDDDTFDYWPSGARLLLALAADLDHLDPDGRLEASRAAINEVLADIPDFRDELADKIPTLEADRA